jgi:hypothetical protein
MKANEAPEKAYFHGDYLDFKFNPFYSINIEYIRKDAFIEKVESFLNRKDDRDYYTIGYIKRHLQEIIKEIGL